MATSSARISCYGLRVRIAALLCLIAACGGASFNYDYAKEPDPRRSEDVIGVSDHLAIKVWKNAELSTEVIVRPAGAITLPLLRAIHPTPSPPTAPTPQSPQH